MNEPSTAQLVGRLSEQVTRLARDEVRLAALEMQAKGKRVGVGAGLLGGAGVLAWFGLGTFIACAVLALALVMPGWLAALVVAVVVLAVAGVLALVGRKQIQRATPPVPTEAIDGIKHDISVVSERAHR